MLKGKTVKQHHDDGNRDAAITGFHNQPRLKRLG